MSDWQETTLGEVCDAVHGLIQTGPFGSQLHQSDYSEHGVPVVMPKDIVGGRISSETVARVSSDHVDRLSRHKLSSGDIVYGRRGDIGRQALIRSEQEGWMCGTGCLRISLGESILNPLFLHYYLSQDEVVGWITNQAVGATMPNLNTGILRSVPVRYPSLPIQRRIAGILSAYDDLIENSQRRIKILEEMARRLYREWFVYFRFPGHEGCRLVQSPLGEIPEGWEVCNLKDAATVTYGFPFASKKFNTSGIGTPVIRIRDIPAGLSATFTGESAEDRYHVKNGHILIGMDGDFHMCIWSSGHAFQNQRVARFESNGQIGNFHLFLALECPVQEFNKAIVGTTVAHLGDMHIKTIKLVWPPYELRAKARDVLEPMSEQIIDLKCQIQNLRRTRDLLLPRLLSGQIDVWALPEPALSEP
jgi:type I restriction enzyme S subunit